MLQFPCSKVNTVLYFYSQFFGIAAGLVAFLAFVPYVISIFHGKTKPERATWFIWLIVGIVILVSYISSGAKDTIWVALSYVVAPLVVVILSIKYGVGGWTRLDKICLSLVACSLLLWSVFKSSEMALYLNIGIDFLGAVPTVFKTYKDPRSESQLAWGVSLISSVLNIFAIDQLNFSVVVYPIYMFCLMVTMFVLVNRRKTLYHMKH